MDLFDIEKIMKQETCIQDYCFCVDNLNHSIKVCIDGPDTMVYDFAKEMQPYLPMIINMSISNFDGYSINVHKI